MVIYIVVGCFILFDIITGILKAFYYGKINSTGLRTGLYHKLSEIIAVAGAGLLEFGVKYVDIGVDIPVLNVVAIYICIMELISILENICEVNPKLCELFKPYLEKLNGNNTKNKNTDNVKEISQ